MQLQLKQFLTNTSQPMLFTWQLWLVVSLRTSNIIWIFGYVRHFAYMIVYLACLKHSLALTLLHFFSDVISRLVITPLIPVLAITDRDKEKKEKRKKNRNNKKASRCTCRTSQHFNFCTCPSKHVVKHNASGKKGTVSCCKCLFSRLELIWLMSSLKISLMSKKMHFFQESMG